MRKNKSLFLILVVLGALSLVLAACGAEAPPVEQVDCPEAPPCPDCEECPEPEACPDCPEPEACPDCPEVIAPSTVVEAWLTSGHADASAEAFRHWDADGAEGVSGSCAKCHSGFGYQDFVGADGSAFGAIDAEVTPSGVVDCATCHSDAAEALDSVVMPSGAEITGLGGEARCMQCHQGRASALSIDGAVAELDPDAVSEDLGFINIHYFAAAATKYGTMAMGGYQYAGKSYDGNFAHVESYDTCQECHDPHTLEIEVESCAHCHDGVASTEDLKDIRMLSSAVDYDGDGDIEEGVYYEIAGLKETLYAAIQAYAADAGTPIIYDSHAYPYFFIDTDADGAVTEGEANYGNKYNAWTPRLLKAAYNFQVAKKDPGGYAHGGKYIIQLLVDSIEDLGADVSALQRIDHGHFAGSEEAFRHWDAEEENPYVVSASCAKCHTAEGLPQFFAEGEVTDLPAANGFQCETCHDVTDWPGRYAFESVTFPSGATIEGEGDQFVCMQCHQGRASGLSVVEATEGIGADEVFEGGFINVHYFAAGATRYGSEVNGVYQYEGKDYVGYFAHVDGATACSDCHDAHELEVDVASCSGCHGTEDLHAINMGSPDYDGDGEAEGVAGEIETLEELLYAAIQAYAAEKSDPIIYALAYPYFFIDTNGNGAEDPGEGIYPNKYANWTPNLLAAAYNYQYAHKDPGAYAHNAKYVIQALYDSIEALGGDVSGLTRP